MFYERFASRLPPGTGQQGEGRAPPFGCPENKAVQKAGLHRVPRYFYFIVEHTELRGLPSAASEKNNKLDQN